MMIMVEKEAKVRIKHPRLFLIVSVLLAILVLVFISFSSEIISVLQSVREVADIFKNLLNANPKTPKSTL